MYLWFDSLLSTPPSLHHCCWLKTALHCQLLFPSVSLGWCCHRTMCRIPVSSMKAIWEPRSSQFLVNLYHRSGRLFHLTPGGTFASSSLISYLLNFIRKVSNQVLDIYQFLPSPSTNHSTYLPRGLLHWNHAGVEFEDPNIPFGQFGTMRLAASVDFPRQLPLQEGEQPFRLRIMRLGLKSRILWATGLLHHVPYLPFISTGSYQLQADCVLFTSILHYMWARPCYLWAIFRMLVNIQSQIEPIEST